MIYKEESSTGTLCFLEDENSKTILGYLSTNNQKTTITIMGKTDDPETVLKEIVNKYRLNEVV